MDHSVSERTHRFEDAVVRDFGSVQELRRAFARAVRHDGGHGCLWLILSSSGEVQIVLTPKQHAPQGSVLAFCDLWDGGRVSFRKESEDERCLRRWHAIDWDEVGARYDKLMRCRPLYPAP